MEITKPWKVVVVVMVVVVQTNPMRPGLHPLEALCRCALQTLGLSAPSSAAEGWAVGVFSKCPKACDISVASFFPGPMKGLSDSTGPSHTEPD